MLKKFTLIHLLLAPFFADAQSDTGTASLPDALQVRASYSTHSSGDLQGFSLDLGIAHPFGRRFDMVNGITTTIHTQAPSPLPTTTAGLQLTSVFNFNLNLVSRLPKQVKIGAGPILRYESTSVPEVFGYTLDNGTSTIFLSNINKLNTFAIGYNVGVGFISQLGTKHQLGFRLSFQSDTNVATITHAGLVLGRFVQFSRGSN